MIPPAQQPIVLTERLDLHNVAIDEPAATAGHCGTIHLPSGRICQAAAHHTDSCDFQLGAK
jgi:hypothetical protein